MIRGEVKGIRVDHEKVRRAVAAAAVEPVRKCGLLVERAAKTAMRRGGAFGRIGARGGYIRTASAPGTPPHVQKGALRASIQTAMTAQRHAVVGPTEKYGAVHEFGTRTHPQRAFMRPALRRTQRRFASQFKRLRLQGR